jgi:hypothetical protein
MAACGGIPSGVQTTCMSSMNALPPPVCDQSVDSVDKDVRVLYMCTARSEPKQPVIPGGMKTGLKCGFGLCLI